MYDEIGLSNVRVGFACYDWLYAAFSVNDRLDVEDTLIRYARQIFSYLQKLSFTNFPGISHASRLPAYLGEAAMVLYGIVPREEAMRWLQYALDVYTAILPHYGDEQGGWAEGPFYAASYTKWPLPFFGAVERTTGFSFLNQPFYRNLSHFFLHLGHPFWDVHPFGDGYWCGWRDREWRGFFAQNPLAGYAERFGPPAARELSRQLRADINHFELHVVDAFLPAKPAASAADSLQESRVFRGAGFISMHSCITDSKADNAILMRASTHGSASHQHADQGNICIVSKGRGMLVPSGGFNPPEGGNHHGDWTQQTIAHNCLLVGGRGQTTRSPQSIGRISDFCDDGNIVQTVLDLAEAYPGVLSCRRTLHFLRPNVIFLHDEVVTETLWLRTRCELASAALKRGGVFAVHRTAGYP